MSPCMRTEPASFRRASRVGSTRKRSTGIDVLEVALQRDLDIVMDLERSEQGGVGLQPPRGLGDHRTGAERPALGDLELEGDRVRPAADGQLSNDSETT